MIVLYPSNLHLWAFHPRGQQVDRPIMPTAYKEMAMKVVAYALEFENVE
jgi:hypothetical protein